MSSITNLQSSGMPRPNRLSGMIRKPGQYLCPDGVVFDELERAIRRHLFQHILPSTMNRAERYLVIQGDPGTGKSVAACDASLRYGFAVALVPASMLASENEGGASAVLDDFMAEMVRQSQADKQRLVVVADDFDLSICGTDATTGKTINSNLLTGRLQHLADNRDQYRSWDDTCIPIIFTGNDFTLVRASLFRDGRASWHTHAPDADTKTQIAFQLLDPRTSDERHMVERLARSYRNEPVAFWTSLKNDLVKARLDEVIARGLPDVAAAEEELAKRKPLRAEQLWAFAKLRAKTKPLSFL